MNQFGSGKTQKITATDSIVALANRADRAVQKVGHSRRNCPTRIPFCSPLRFESVIGVAYPKPVRA
jgi:hypothetical protein